jgi:hypothetical protein
MVSDVPILAPEVTMVRRIITILAIVFVVAVLAYPQPNVQDTIESPFSSGGTVHLRLSYGEYTIKSGSADRIVVRWIDSHGVDIRDRLTLDATRDTANIRGEGPIKHGHFVVEIPARSDIFLRLKAGDVKISGIEGNKDVHMTAGDLNIEADPASYSSVHGSVTIGDLDAHTIHISKGGFHRSFDWRGTGPYNLRASIVVGDLTIR